MKAWLLYQDIGLDIVLSDTCVLDIVFFPKQSSSGNTLSSKRIDFHTTMNREIPDTIPEKRMKTNHRQCFVENIFVKNSNTNTQSNRQQTNRFELSSHQFMISIASVINRLQHQVTCLRFDAGKAPPIKLIHDNVQFTEVYYKPRLLQE